MEKDPTVCAILFYQIQLEKYRKPKYAYNEKLIQALCIHNQKAFREFRVKKIFHFNLLLFKKINKNGYKQHRIILVDFNNTEISNINSVKKKIIEKEIIKLKTFLYLIKTVTLKYLYHFYNVALNNVV